MALRICTFGLLILGIARTENTGCKERSLIGKNHLNISDSSYTASSSFDYRYKPYKAKLYGNYGWSPRVTDNPNDYLQIDLGTERVVTAVATQGNGGDKDDPQHRVRDDWVKRYKLYLTNDISTLNNNHRYDTYQLFEGNSDSTTAERRSLKKPTTARYVRFVPVDYHRYKVMRVDVYFYEEQLLVTATPGKTSVYLNWTFTQCSPKNYVIGYVVEIDNSTSELTRDQPRYNLTNLKPYTKYSVSVKVIRQQGYGVWRETLKTKTTIAEPETSPTLTSIEASSSETIVIKWKAVQISKVNGPLEGYQITYKPQGGNTKTIDVGVVTMYNLTSLLKYTNYNITVAVRNTKYIGPTSKEQAVRTLEGAPSTPRNVSAQLTVPRDLTRPQVIITWDRPRDLNGIIRKYTIVYYYDMNTFNEKIVTISKTSDLQYIIDDTRKGILSYKISASTVKEGPYAYGKDLFIPSFLGEPNFTLNPESITNTSAVLTMFNGSLTFQVIIKKIDNEALKSDNQISNQLPTNISNSDKLYVTAQLSGYNITIGDGQVYGGFKNTPLKPGSRYRIYVRVLLNNGNGSTFYSNVSHVDMRTKPKDMESTKESTIFLETKEKPWYSNFLVIILLCVVGALIVVIVLLMVLLRRVQRKAQEKGQKEFNDKNMYMTVEDALEIKNIELQRENTILRSSIKGNDRRKEKTYANLKGTKSSSKNVDERSYASLNEATRVRQEPVTVKEPTALYESLNNLNTSVKEYEVIDADKDAANA